ncbi:MAG: NAD(P)H-dependent oxidoreductase [Verrucomicrobiota bacterium]
MAKSDLKVVAFAGSTREGSYNQSVLDAVVDALVEAGAEVERVRLAEFTMPLFDQDLEGAEGLPENARKLKRIFDKADAFVIASPEYNSAFTPLTKNVIDWCSRAESEDEEPCAVYQGKTVLLVSASPGPGGGIRGLYALRSILQNIGVTVYPEMRAVRSVFQLVDDRGVLTDDEELGKLGELGRAFVTFADKLAG